MGVLRVAALLFSAGSLALAAPPQRGNAQAAESHLTDTRPTSETPPPSVDEFSHIGNFRIALVGGESHSLAEVVNLFPTRNRRRFHGSIYEFHRNDNFDARNFFDPIGAPLPEFKRNQFGFNLGSSFFDDRLTVLGSFDGLRIIQGSTEVTRVPTRAQKAGDFSALETKPVDPLTGERFPGDRIPQERMDPAAQAMLSVLPDPNRDENDRNFVNNQPLIVNQDSFSIRADYRIGDDAKIFGDYSFQDNQGNEVEDLPPFEVIGREREQQGSLSYDRTFGQRLSISTEISFDRSLEQSQSINAGTVGLLDSIGISGLAVRGPEDEGYPEFELEGYAAFGDADSPNAGTDNELSLDGTFTYAFESHTLTAGAELELLQSNNHRNGRDVRGSFEFTGSFSGDAFADFLLGLPNAASRATGTDRMDLRGRRLEAFVRDQWRINSKFDLSVSLRYDYSPPFRSNQDNLSTFAPLLFEPPTDGRIVIAGSSEAVAAGLPADSRSLVHADLNNWSPSLSLAYSPFGNSSLVLRAFYDVSHDSINRRSYIRFLGRNFPFYFFETALSPNDRPQLTLSTPFDTLTPTELNVHGFQPRLRTPYFQNWNLTLQTEFIRRWNLEIAYTATKGTRLLRSLPANIPLPGEGAIQPRRPNPMFGTFEIQTDGASSIRHGINAILNRRLADGFSIRSEFWWNRTISDSTGEPQNPRDYRSERGLTDDPPRRLSFNYIWDLPFSIGAANWLRSLTGGWRLTGTTRFVSGQLFSATLSEDRNNDGLGNDRPDLIGSPASGFAPSVDEWFDTSVFALPSGEFGTAGRNILFAPGRRIWDISFSKSTRLGDSDVLELRIELFNAFNNVNFDRPESAFGTSVFGQIFGAGRAREIEIALKYSF